MKLPNLRLYGTQARAGVVFALVSLWLLAALAYCVFKGLQWEHRTIPYNSQQGLGQFRPYIVYGLTALVVAASVVAALFGYSSLGERRNDKPALSWLGLLVGCLVLASAPLLCLFWRVLSEAIIITGR